MIREANPKSIITRRANDIMDLFSADDVTILDFNDVNGEIIAAPHMFYYNNIYWILVETFPHKFNRIWNTINKL